MANEKPLNRKKLSLLIVLCGIALVFIVYLIAGILPPVAVDYTGSANSCAEEDENLSSEDAKDILLSDDGITADGNGLVVTGSNVRITAPGVYRLTGNLTGGCIYIAAESGSPVHLILAGAQITNSESPPIYVSAADKVIITLEEGTENTTTALAESGLESAIYSECDLTFNGSGSLAVHSENGIAVNGKTNVRFVGGTISISAKQNAVKAKYGVLIKDGNLTITAGADGICTTGTGQTRGKWVGTVAIEGGTITIESDCDGISAGSVIAVTGGEVNIITGGGSEEQASNQGFGMGGPPGQQMGGAEAQASNQDSDTSDPPGEQAGTEAQTTNQISAMDMGGPPGEQTSNKSAVSAKGLKAEQCPPKGASLPLPRQPWSLSLCPCPLLIA